MINTIKKNFIDYDSCTNFSYKKLYDTSDEFDVTVIIPVRNRFEFLELLLNTLINSEKNGFIK